MLILSRIVWRNFSHYAYARGTLAKGNLKGTTYHETIKSVFWNKVFTIWMYTNIIHMPSYHIILFIIVSHKSSSSSQSFAYGHKRIAFYSTTCTFFRLLLFTVWENQIYQKSHQVMDHILRVPCCLFRVQVLLRWDLHKRFDWILQETTNLVFNIWNG